MSGIEEVLKCFAEKCTACGLCVECCPVIQHTDLKGALPSTIMEETLDLFQRRGVGALARTRVYSCLFCNMCKEVCPEGLYPGLSFGAAKAILQEMNDPVPRGVAAVLPVVSEMLRQAIPTLNIEPSQLITDLTPAEGTTCKTVLFSSCYGLLQPQALIATLKIMQRIDPDVKVFGGFDNCCGELQFMAGKPVEAERQFARLIDKIDALSPENVVIFCPTCNMHFDHHAPEVQWSRHFITDYIADRLDQLGPFQEVKATVTIHDPCHFVRGEKPGSDSPRKILKAIPGIKILEMENSGEDALCCGAYAITGLGKQGKDFRTRRLRQAKATGADILSLYCPGCQMVLGQEGPNYGLEVLSILNLLGQSMKI